MRLAMDMAATAPSPKAMARLFSRAEAMLPQPWRHRVGDPTRMMVR